MNTSVHTKKVLLHRLSAHKNQIKAFGVKELGLFGSFKQGTNIHISSDVDFFIEFEKGQKSYDNFIGLSFYLEELLGRKVELVTSKSLSKFIGPHILKDVEYVNL
jgi:predicted nucleotidyltransferase